MNPGWYMSFLQFSGFKHCKNPSGMENSRSTTSVQKIDALSYLQSCPPLSSFWAAPAGWGPPLCLFAGFEHFSSGWLWTCSRFQPGRWRHSAPAAPPCSRCSPRPGWWSWSPDQTHHPPAAGKEKEFLYVFKCFGKYNLSSVDAVFQLEATWIKLDFHTENCWPSSQPCSWSGLSSEEKLTNRPFTYFPGHYSDV